MSEATTVALPQDTDIPPRREDTPLASLLVASARSQEAVEGDLPNEDYVTFRYDDSRLALALCDGVGQSFFGGIAARFLGQRLLEWLWALPTGAAQNGAKQAERLFNELHAWTTPASELVKERSLPEDSATSLRRIALERKRRSGSACVFACALISLSAGRTSCLAFWLGNTRLRFWDAGGGDVPLATDYTASEQWSTARGPLNSDMVHHLVLPSLAESGVERLTLHTDGVHRFEDQLSGLTKARLEGILRQLAEDPASDDVSLLDVKLKQTNTAHA